MRARDFLPMGRRDPMPLPPPLGGGSMRSLGGGGGGSGNSMRSGGGSGGGGGYDSVFSRRSPQRGSSNGMGRFGYV